MYFTAGMSAVQSDPNVQITMESTDRPELCLSNFDMEKVIRALHACPHGVIGMSHDIEGLVETSTNLASVNEPVFCLHYPAPYVFHRRNVRRSILLHQF